MNKTATTSTARNGRASASEARIAPAPVFSTISIIIIAVLAVAAIVFGVLWGMQFFGPDYKKQATQLQTGVDTLKTEAQQLRELNALLLEQVGDPLEVGFEVQVAAFENYQIAARSEDLVRMAEFKENNLNKYVLGRFARFEDAEAFLKDLKKMGLFDAFIAGIVDGKRATVAEAKKASWDFYGDP